MARERGRPGQYEGEWLQWGPRTPCGARTRYRYAVARKARTGLPWEIPLPGGLGTLGGRAWPWALPRQREGGLPGRGVSASAGRGAPKEGPGPKGSTGEGTPRRDPGGPAGRSRPNGRARSGLLDQPQPSPGWEMGRGARGSPRDGHRRNRGEAPRPPAGGVGAAAKGPAGLQAVESPGLRDALIPKGPPLSPPPTGGGFRRYAGRPWRARSSASRP